VTLFSSLYGGLLDIELSNEDSTELFTTTRRKAAVNRDLEWTARANAWLAGLSLGVIISADDLIAEEGLPKGSANQVGARFSAWAKAGLIRIEGVKTAHRRESHGRLVRTWRVIA
jgi:hypothetical protein